MAYTRNETEKLEISYPLQEIWDAIPKAVETLQWKIEEKDDQTHKAKIRSKGAFMSYSSTLDIEVTAVDEKTTRMTINAETPVTTITSMLDIGRTQDRLETFIETLARQIEKNKASKT